MEINIDYQDKPIRDALNRLLKAGNDLSPLLRTIGEDLLTSTKERFNSQEDPEGKEWKALSETTLVRKQKNKDKILTERGYLRDNIVSQLAGKNTVDIGSTRIYASTHQFGAKRGAFGKTKRGAPIPWGDIPARPFLGISGNDKEMILETINNFIARQWR